MKIGTNILGNYKLGTEREYLITNGLGSFSSASINGNHARQYHGLFISSNIPPLDRFVLVHKVEEELNGFNLGTNKEIKADKVFINPAYKNLYSFNFDDFLTWTYSKNGVFLKKEQFMLYEREILGLKYGISSLKNQGHNLKTNFFMNYRDIHTMLKLHEQHTYTLKVEDNILKIKINELNKEFYVMTNGTFHINEDLDAKEYDFEGNLNKPFVKENLAYDIELDERGSQSLDSSINNFYIEKELKNNDDLWILIVNEDIQGKEYDFYKFYEEEQKRMKDIKNKVSKNNTFLRDLAQAADNFIVHRESTKEKTILAGYPWFGDWGRDTMIALPGLTLASGRYEDAKSILKTFSHYVNQGMLPNKFPDYAGEELMYNTIDASLWYFYAVHKYLEYTKDYDFVKNEILDSLEEILDFHIKGTRYGIIVDKNDGLLKGGDEKTQLTWMDVKFQGVAITPRFGKTVEINALWYNALKIHEDICKNINKEYPSLHRELYEKIEKNYTSTFWNEREEFLYDYVNEDIKNNDIRPNAVFVLSLPYELLSKEKSKKVLEKVFEELWTPRGLRSLSREDENYIGFYYGYLFYRDSCYHQGTVWSWLLGHFLDAHYKLYQDKEFVANLMEGVKEHFYNDGAIKSISEIFDGDEPHSPRGCYAQAWSVGEMLRIAKEILDKE